MLKPTSSRITKHKTQDSIVSIYTVVFLLIVHASIIVYVNSSLLSQYLTTAEVSGLYTISAAVGLLIFLFISRVLRKVGNFKLTFCLLLIEFFAIASIAFFDSARVVIPLFLVHAITLPIIFFNIDVFVEAALDKKESHTGTKRTIILSIVSLVYILSSIVMGYSVSLLNNFSLPYFISALSLLPIFIILWRKFRHFPDPKYHELDIFKAIRSFWVNRNIRLVFYATLTLQIFFSFTVIYYPLYLVTYLGIPWEHFGIILSAATLAYLFFEYPVGYLADNYIGEKEMMALGFMLLGITTAMTAAITTTSLLFWVIFAFVNRIGASLVEATTESYFFKKTKSSDAQVISFFRASRPLSYILLSLFGAIALLFLPFNLIFVVAGLLMVPAMFAAMKLEDTK